MGVHFFNLPLRCDRLNHAQNIQIDLANALSLSDRVRVKIYKALLIGVSDFANALRKI